MSRKNKTPTNIITIDSLSNTSYSFYNNEILPHDIQKSNKNKEFYISYIPFKDILTTTVEIPRTIADEDVASNVTIKTYEDLSLDTTVDYKISYSEVDNGTENRSFNIFAIDTNIINNIFHDTVSKTDYIDYMAIPPLLFGSLYNKNLLSSASCDCFIYMQKNDAFITVYQGGEHIQSRQLRYSLQFINEKFCELKGDRLNEAKFLESLKSDGIENADPADRNYLQQIFEDAFYYIFDVIKNINKIYNINIGNVYFGTEIGQIPDLENLLEKIIEIKVNELKFNVAINSKDYNPNPLHSLMILSVQDYVSKPDDSFNFSPYLRPPPFSKRQSGKLILLIIAALVVSLIYPIFEYSTGIYYNTISDRKDGEYEIKHAKEIKIKNILTQLQNAINTANKDIQAENEKLNFRKNILSEIYYKKINYPIKSIVLNNMAKVVDDNNVKVSQILNDDKSITISVRSTNDINLTALIKDISQNPMYSVTTQSITDNNLTNKYESNISVGIR